MNLACVGQGIWVGSFDACDAVSGRFPLVIHIAHPDPNVERCRALGTRGAPGLAVEYADGESLAEASVPLEAVIAYSRREGDLLIHCAWGVCRSPTLAVLCKAARGGDPFQALADVARGTWRGYRVAPQLLAKPVTEILHWHFGESGGHGS